MCFLLNLLLQTDFLQQEGWLELRISSLTEPIHLLRFMMEALIQMLLELSCNSFFLREHLQLPPSHRWCSIR